MTEDQASPGNGEAGAEPGEVSFIGLVLSLAHTAAVHLGDAIDPVKGTAGPPNLAAARQMVDILGLLEAKTRGNLTAEERQVLEQILYELRLRCAEVARSHPPDVPASRIILP